VIYWDLRTDQEHPGLTAGEPPDGFLSNPERVYLSRLRTPKRRHDWLLGRWTGKALIRAWLRERGRAVPAEAITIAPDDDGAPFVLVVGEGRLGVTVSLSHCEGCGLAVLASEREAPLGADIERCEPRSPEFINDFFTPAEIKVVGAWSDTARAATEVWSVKESALKAVRLGLNVDTRRVEIAPRVHPAPGWSAVGVDLSLPHLPTRGSAFVRDWDPYLISVAWLGVRAEQEPSDALRGMQVLDDTLAPVPPANPKGVGPMVSA
jgi:4'-phosphopantetheinyl transferase